MKNVGIAELKARLSAYLREVRSGRSFTVMDRQTPVARVIPYAPDAGNLRVRRPLRSGARLREVPLPPRLRVKTDIVDLLLEERQGER